LTKYFTVLPSGLTPVSYEMDFEGDGIIDYTGDSFEDVSFIYTTEGIYYPEIRVTDDQGNTYTDKIAIVVHYTLILLKDQVTTVQQTLIWRIIICCTPRIPGIPILNMPIIQKVVIVTREVLLKEVSVITERSSILKINLW